MKNKNMKIYRHIYDNPIGPSGDEKPNELLGDFEVEGNMDGYSFEVTGKSNDDGKTYGIFGHEVSALTDRYNAGTKVFIEEIRSS